MVLPPAIDVIKFFEICSKMNKNIKKRILYKRKVYLLNVGLVERQNGKNFSISKYQIVFLDQHEENSILIF